MLMYWYEIEPSVPERVVELEIPKVPSRKGKEKALTDMDVGPRNDGIEGLDDNALAYGGFRKVGVETGGLRNGPSPARDELQGWEYDALLRRGVVMKVQSTSASKW